MATNDAEPLTTAELDALDALNRARTPGPVDVLPWPGDREGYAVAEVDGWIVRSRSTQRAPAANDARALADDLYAFLDRPRGARPHFHACTECYEDEACGLDCTTDEDEDNPAVQRGGFGVCSLCKRARAVEGASK